MGLKKKRKRRSGRIKLEREAAALESEVEYHRLCIMALRSKQKMLRTGKMDEKDWI